VEEWVAVRTDWSEARAFAPLDESTQQQLLQAAARFSSEVLAPINSSGDLAG
jgi:hypothetical protein